MPGLALCCAMAEREEGRGPHMSGSDGGRQLRETVWRRSAPADIDAKLQLFPVPARGMRLVVVDSPTGEGELRRQLASAPAELRRRHGMEPRQQQWCGQCCLAGVGAWPRLPAQERR
jgi:hypothetical protein